jgi:hypothetical protein
VGCTLIGALVIGVGAALFAGVLVRRGAGDWTITDAVLGGSLVVTGGGGGGGGIVIVGVGNAALVAADGATASLGWSSRRVKPCETRSTAETKMAIAATPIAPAAITAELVRYQGSPA